MNIQIPCFPSAVGNVTLVSDLSGGFASPKGEKKFSTFNISSKVCKTFYFDVLTLSIRNSQKISLP